MPTFPHEQRKGSREKEMRGRSEDLGTGATILMEPRKEIIEV